MNRKIPRLTSGRVARYLGVTKQTVVNWDNDGIFIKTKRLKNGYRVFDTDEVAKIKANIDLFSS